MLDKGKKNESILKKCKECGKTLLFDEVLQGYYCVTKGCDYYTFNDDDDDGGAGVFAYV